MEVWEALEGLKKKARADETLKKKLLETKNHKNPVSTFCRISTEEGFPLYEMDLISYGEESYASMKRSTNGGGENAPLLMWEDDAYEMFMMELEMCQGLWQ